MEELSEQQQVLQPSLPKTPVPPYEAWPSAPRGSIEAHIQNEKSHVMNLDNMMSPSDRHSRATSALSMEDIEAAQALEGLRDFMPSPTRSATVLPDRKDVVQYNTSESAHPEPLLSLITSQHPLLSTAINGSLSAYSSSKSYSPRFKYGAEFVERNIASPVVNTVGTAGRISGVETGVRWWLQRSDSNGMPDGSNKRRRIDDDHEREMDVEKGLQDVTLRLLRQRASSSISYPESLPAYDDQRSPSYEEQSPVVQLQRPRHDASSPSSRTWQSRLMLSTSGLGVAMSEESLRSLKYCLTWLKWANSHLGRVLVSLQNVLDEWQRSREPQSSQGFSMTNGANMLSIIPSPPARDEATITQHIQALKSECLQTLKNVVDTVSKYAGGALPENARILVRRHLTSLPQRFRVASTTTSSSNRGDHDNEKLSGAPEVISGAQRVVVLAKEGLVMMAQVSDVVNGTIVSAEDWCDRLGKKKEEQKPYAIHNGNHEKEVLAQREADVQMSGQDEKRG